CPPLTPPSSIGTRPLPPLPSFPTRRSSDLNWTIVYAGWEKVPETPPTVTVPSTPTPDEHPDIAEGIANGTWGGTPTPTPTAQTKIGRAHVSTPATPPARMPSAA